MEGNRARDDTIEIPEVTTTDPENIVLEEEATNHTDDNDSLDEQSSSWVNVQEETVDNDPVVDTNPVVGTNPVVDTNPVDTEPAEDKSSAETESQTSSILPPSYTSSTIASTNNISNDSSSQDKKNV